MKRAVELQRRLHVLGGLHEAVVAMKSLAAHHLRESRARVPSARAYREGVERIAALAPSIVTNRAGPHGILLVGGELGLCGNYNSAIVAAALARRQELGAGPTLCIGRRASLLIERHGVAIDASYTGPTTVHGITNVLLRVAEDILTMMVEQRLAAFHVVASRFDGVGVSHPTSAQLVPFVNDAPGPPLPVRYVTAEALASSATREQLFAMLFDMLLGALASEHGARLVATQSAERWLAAQTERLACLLTAARRETATQEMLETATAYRRRA